MARKLRFDKWLFIAALLLVCTSVVMVYSVSAVSVVERLERPYFFLGKQAFWAILGGFFVPVIMGIDYRTYRQPTVIWGGLAMVVAALVAVLFSAPIKGAARWLDLGPLGFQPSELAKLVVIFLTAALLERRMDRINEIGYSLVPIGMAVGLVATLVMAEPDLGTAATILMISASMVFAAGLSYTYIAGLLLAAIPGLAFLIVTSPYRMKRILTFLDPASDQQAGGYQIMQSLIAIGTGGITGRGLMDGVQKSSYLPEPHNDFIFSVIAEELGLIGASVVVACFCVIAWRGLRTALRAPDRFGAFVAIGLTTMMAFQAFLNISVVLGLLPTKGIPLPFVSAGGSSLLINMIGMAVLLNISQHASPTHVVTVASPLRP